MTLLLIAKATVLLAAALIGAAWLMQRRAAAARFAVLAAVMLALLVLPALEMLVPRWQPAATRSLLSESPATVVSAARMAPAESPLTPAPGSWLPWVWLAGTVIFSIRSAGGYLLAWRRRPLVPVTIGVFRPRVVLPPGAEGWSGELRRAVLLHEQAHIARRDPLWNLIAQLARAVYWFHPLMWLALRRLHAERERACDDVVLASGMRPSDYAAHLMTCAGWAAATAPPPAAGLAMAGQSHLASRVEAVLSPATVRAPFSFWQRAALAAACCALLLPLAAFGSPSIQPRSFTMFRKLALPFLAAASAAQAADLSGRVYDASNATVPKAQVVLRDHTTAAEFKTASGPAGEYQFASLPAGDYEMEVLMPGFARYQRRGIRLAENSSTTVSAILKLGEVQETVQVTAPGQARPQQRPPRRILVGGSVQPVRLLKQVKAAYPDTARAEGREGNVTLRAVIGVDGTIVNVAVLPGADADLAAAAEQAVRQWVYQPTLLNGKPVETVTSVEVSFRLGPA